MNSEIFVGIHDETKLSSLVRISLIKGNLIEMERLFLSMLKEAYWSEASSETV